MDNRPLTPQEKLEERRLWRYWCRWYRRHHRHGGFVLYGDLIPEYLAELKFVGLKECLNRQAHELKLRNLIPKFCNGLIGVARNDSLPASAALIC